MKIAPQPWVIPSLCGLKNKINTRPDYQRPSVWKKSQKQLLIDSILRGYSVPKFYLREIENKSYEVVDGQQRIRSIWAFCDNEYPLDKNLDPIDGIDVSGMYYKDLPIEIRTQTFDLYQLSMEIITDSNEEEVREMFLRLQNGTSLKSQEKRNAMSGNMRDLIKEFSTHNIFNNAKFKNDRYTFDLIMAQMMLLELNGGICNVKNTDLNKMYKENMEISKDDIRIRKSKKILDYLLNVFPEKTPELNRYSIISLYTLISFLSDKYVIKDREKEIYSWFLNFENTRRVNKDLDDDKRSIDLVDYREKISHSSDSADSISWRHDFLLKDLFLNIPNIELKDNNRNFTHEQRLAIFRKNDSICQIKKHCDGEKCSWDNWDADHIIPWSKGGKTLVENGQVACSKCNKSKSNSI